MNVENMCNVDRELRGGKRAVIVFQRMSFCGGGTLVQIN